MKRAEEVQDFKALKICGDILLASYTQEIARCQATFQTFSDYGLAGNDMFSTVLERKYTLFKELWRIYLQDGDCLKWTRNLLIKVLDFDDLCACDSQCMDGRSYPVNFGACANTLPILVSSASTSLDECQRNPTLFKGRRSPFSLLQEYLNVKGKGWGLVLSGCSLRLLRDNCRLSRPAFLEVDLQTLAEDRDLFSDFRTFWLLCHASRFRIVHKDDGTTILDAWALSSHETGQRLHEKPRE